ncbi:hypothetical protein COL922a_000561 [Colletotrichum nupharicola]|nr:hypothetical protein COL922a_000561 [Colletotrichum nupharicola]
MSSSHMDMDDPETLLEGSQKIPKKTPKKPLQYPADIPRVTRFGRGTYGVKTGPLPDGTDWSKLSVDIIKEQLMMRNVPTDGRKQVLVNRLQNWQTYYDGQTVDVRPVAEGFDPADEGASSTPKSTKKQRNGVPVNDHRHIMSTKKAMTQRMYIICSTPTRSGRRISDDELATIFARAPKIRPTQAEIDNDPAFKDGVPKSKEGKDCIVCYQAFGDLETVCCGTCGHYAHT